MSKYCQCSLCAHLVFKNLNLRLSFRTVADLHKGQRRHCTPFLWLFYGINCNFSGVGVFNCCHFTTKFIFFWVCTPFKNFWIRHWIGATTFWYPWVRMAYGLQSTIMSMTRHFRVLPGMATQVVSTHGMRSLYRGRSRRFWVAGGWNYCGESRQLKGSAVIIPQLRTMVVTSCPHSH